MRQDALKSIRPATIYSSLSIRPPIYSSPWLIYKKNIESDRQIQQTQSVTTKAYANVRRLAGWSNTPQADGLAIFYLVWQFLSKNIKKQSFIEI